MEALSLSTESSHYNYHSATKIDALVLKNLGKRIYNSTQKDIDAIRNKRVSKQEIFDSLSKMCQVNSLVSLDWRKSHYSKLSNFVTEADEYVHRLFGIDRFSNEDLCASNGGVYIYQPSYVDWLIDMIPRLHLTSKDVFYDLGSGRGLVVNLMGMLTDAKIVGVEYFQEYASDSYNTSCRLELDKVATVNSDVCDVNFYDGTVFFMFNPFGGNILKNVIARLKKVAKTKAKNGDGKIRICCVCNNDEFDKLPWLNLVSTSANEKQLTHGTCVDIYESIY